MALFEKKIVKDAKNIHETIDYKVLRAAWDSFVRIKKKGFAKTHQSSTPAWFCLFSIINYKGNLNKFHENEIHLLKSFTEVQDSYNEIIEQLSNNENNQQLVEHILATHPNLQEALPDEYKTPSKVIEYLLLEVKQYQLMLLDFYNAHQKKIDNAIKKLEKSLAK